MDFKGSRWCMMRVDIRLDAENTQRRWRWIQLPGCIQHLDLADNSVLIRLKPAMSQGKSFIRGGVAKRKMDIGIIINQVREFLADPLEKRWLETGLGHLYCQHSERITLEQIAALGAYKLERDSLSF